MQPWPAQSPAEHAAMFSRISASRSAAPLAAFAGGALPHTLLSACSETLLPFFSTKAVLPLRATCKDAVAAVAAHPWEDMETVILGSIGGWRACFPRARCANVREWCGDVVRRTPVVDGDFAHLEGLWELGMGGCRAVTDTALAHLRGIRVLDMTFCDQAAVTDAGLAHLVGIQKLSIAYCSQATLTDAALAPLKGIRTLNMSSCPQLTDAAFAHLQGLHTLLMAHCSQPTITDAALAHLGGIQCLVLYGCSMPFTAAGLAHLRGIARLHMGGANAASIAAARGLGLPATTADWTEISAFRWSDREAAWPAEWVHTR